MSVEDRAKELNSLAEKIRGSFIRFNSQLKSISDKRKRISRNVAERKERRSKLKSSASSFGKSIGNISSNILKTPGDIFGKVISFASLLLLGTLVNAIPQRQKRLDDDLKTTKDKSKNVGNFFTGMVAAVQDFIGAFDGNNKKLDNAFNDVDNMESELSSEYNTLKNTFDELEKGFDADSLTPINDNLEEEDEDDDSDIDPKFKKKSGVSLGGLKRNNKIKKNYDEVSKKLLEYDTTLTRFDDSDENTIPFNKKMVINKIDDTFGKNNLEFNEGVGEEGERTLIIRQKVIVDP